MSIIIENESGTPLITEKDSAFFAYPYMMWRRSPDGSVMLTKLTGWSGRVRWTYYNGSVYKNQRTGDVFVASRTGEAIFRTHDTVATDWRYDRTEIMAAPTAKPSLKTAKLDGSTVSVSVSYPASATDSHSNSRATNIEYKAVISLASGGTIESKTLTTTLVSSVSVNVSSAKTAAGKDLIDWSNTTNVKSVAIAVRLKNKNGSGSWVTASVAVKQPDKPKLSAPVQNANTGKVSTTLTVPKSSDKAPVRTTRYKITLYDSRTRSIVRTTQGTATANRTLETDLTGRMALDNANYLKVTFTATAEGVGGKAEAKKQVYYGSIPHTPSLSLQSTGSRVTFRVKTNATESHPTTGMQMYAIVSTAYETESQIPANADWQEVGPTDNGSCNAISVPASDLTPSAGTYTWVKLKVWNDVESVFYNYSKPLRVKSLETPAPITPSAQGDKVYILSHTVLPSGTECAVTFGWLSNDSANETEVSWSTSENAWRSTNQPETFTMIDADWDEGPSGAYGSSATLIISGLEQGETYYVSARRVLEPAEGDITYGEYCSKAKVTMSTQNAAPTSVTLMPAASRYPEGDDLLVRWDYGSVMESEAWKLMQAASSVPSDSDRTLASGVDFRKRYTIPWSVDGVEVIPELVGGGTARLYVVVQVAGITLTSDMVEVSTVTRPSAGLDVDDVTTIPSSTVTVYTDADGAEIALSVTSQGVSWDEPDGLHEQASGEYIWSWQGIPEWSASESDYEYEAEIEIPAGTNLVDGGGYVVALTVTSEGVSSDEVTEEFFVDLARKAPTPSTDIVAEGYDTTDEDGIRTLGATVTLAEPTGYANGDVYDVYRVSGEVAIPVAVGVALDAVIDDTYAPIGQSTEYRIACRTEEGSVSWLAATYGIMDRRPTDPKFCRIDWRGGYVELERGVGPSDSYTKPFETREHMDGSTSGHWGPTIARSMSINAQLIQDIDVSTVNALRTLARYDGPCFLRTSDGIAMACDVQVSMSSRSQSARVDVSIRATEVISDEYGVSIS